MGCGCKNKKVNSTSSSNTVSTATKQVQEEVKKTVDKYYEKKKD
jgi:hypothetical protein